MESPSFSEGEPLLREDYRLGRKFRIVKEGASIRGLLPAGPWCSRGHRVDLPVGTVITCMGVGWSRGDGAPIIRWRSENHEAFCEEAEFHPNNGDMWNCLPEDGYLTPMD
jgi:hypothetical protein